MTNKTKMKVSHKATGKQQVNPKENLDLQEKQPTREMTPADTWDVLSYQLIEEIIVGTRGYKTIMKGRKNSGQGISVVNKEWIPKQTINQGKIMSARVTRLFRAAVSKRIKADKEVLNTQLTEQFSKLSKLKFWQFKQRREAEQKSSVIQAQIGALDVALTHLIQASPQEVQTQIATPKPAPGTPTPKSDKVESPLPKGEPVKPAQ